MSALHAAVFSVSKTMPGTNSCSKNIYCLKERLHLLSSATLLLCPTAHRKDLHSFSSRGFRESLEDSVLEIQPGFLFARTPFEDPTHTHTHIHIKHAGDSPAALVTKDIGI